MSDEQERSPFDEIAAELLKFAFNPLETFEDEDARRAYQLMRTRTFLEMKFGHISALQKEVETLRKWKESTMPIVARAQEQHNPYQGHPLDLSEDNPHIRHNEEE